MLKNGIQTAVIDEARGWVGTRFKHQGRKKNCADDRGGVDCLGLLIGVANACDVRGKDGKPLYVHDQLAYGHHPDGVDLRAGLEAALLPHDDAPKFGDVCLFRIDGVARHVGFIGAYMDGSASMIHAYAPARKVVEHRLDDVWRARLVACFSIPNMSFDSPNSPFIIISS